MTESVYPGKQTINDRSARLILERNVDKLIVVENQTRKKQIKYYLRFDPKLSRNSTHELRGLFTYDLKQMQETAIPRIKCPVLGVFGDTGWPHLDQVAKKMEELQLKNLQVIRMKGSHHLHADEPELFLERISPFLRNAIEEFRKAHPNLNGNGNGLSKL